MPKTVDSIVANHEAARALRQAGKPIWTYEVPLKDALEDSREGGEIKPEGIVQLCKTIATMLRTRLPADWLDGTNEQHGGFTIVDIMNYFDGATVPGIELDLQEGNDPIEEFDQWLDELYDWADANRIWIGHSNGRHEDRREARAGADTRPRSAGG